MVAFNRKFVLTVVMLGACALAGESCSTSSGGGTGGAAAGSGGAPAETGNGGARTGTDGATVDAGSVELIENDAGQLIMPLPVLDPTGIYGGKTYPEWGAEWMKWILEYPGPESLAFNTPGAYCEMEQSMAMGNGSMDAPPFFLGIFDLGGPGGGTFTQACTVPIGRTVLFQMYADWDTSIPGCAQETEQECLAGRSLLASATKIELEIDGKSYGSRVADFAPYLKGCTHFSAAIPNTNGNLIASYYVISYGCSSTRSVLQADIYEAGYWIMLAALAPGPHTIHTRVQAPTDPMYEVTYNLTVTDTSSLGAAGGGLPIDAPSAPDATQPED